MPQKPPGREYEKITSDVRNFFARPAGFYRCRFQTPVPLIFQANMDKCGKPGYNIKLHICEEEALVI
ncbi:hypothetical protein C4J81_05385 [Deltaproteobacteria bacterium Smac51]|nr:hypothetical protein C4J81_05385 [Deltaproteobacteria bacterium Smac51]